MPEQTRQNFVQKSRSLVEDIEQAKREGRLLIYIDEILFFETINQTPRVGEEKL